MRDLTEEEEKLIHDLGGIWNRFIRLEEFHPSDRMEFMIAIHAAENIIAARPVTEVFSKKKKGEEE